MRFSSPSTDALRYVAAGRVAAPSVDLDRAAVESGSTTLGCLAGFLVDPVSRQLRYLVVETGRLFGKVRRLVPFSITTVNPTRGTLCVELDEPAFLCCPEVDPSAVPELSEKDLENEG